MDKRGANKSVIHQIITDKNIVVEVRQVKYLNNIVEKDHRGVKQVTRPMLGFKSFRTAANVLAGIELVDMSRKEQMTMPGCEGRSFADQFYALAG
jgi:transposase-like protein